MSIEFIGYLPQEIKEIFEQKTWIKISALIFLYSMSNEILKF